MGAIPYLDPVPMPENMRYLFELRDRLNDHVALQFPSMQVRMHINFYGWGTATFILRDSNGFKRNGMTQTYIGELHVDGNSGLIEQWYTENLKVEVLAAVPYEDEAQLENKLLCMIQQHLERLQLEALETAVDAMRVLR